MRIEKTLTLTQNEIIVFLLQQLKELGQLSGDIASGDVLFSKEDGEITFKIKLVQEE